MTTKINTQPCALVVSPARKRETPRPQVTFSKILKGGEQLLEVGAKIATQIIAGPVLAAATTAASTGSQSIMQRHPPKIDPDRLRQYVGARGFPILSGATTEATTSGNATTIEGTLLAQGNGQPSPLATLEQARDVTDDLQLLALQEQIHRKNRQIALISNVMKARHDTSKAAISNMRS